MRLRTYLIALALAVAAAVYFATHGSPLGAVLSIVPGYFVAAYSVILVSTLLPGEARRHYREARTAASASGRTRPAPTVAYPAYMGGLVGTTYSGDGVLGWPEGDDLVFLTRNRDARYEYPASGFRGFKVEPSTPSFIQIASPLRSEAGPLILLDGGTATGMVRLWVRPNDLDAFAERLNAAGVPALG